MELIVSPVQVAIRFRQSLIHTLMTVVGLLHVGHRLEGLSDWLRQAEGRLSPETADALKLAAMFNLLATGVQGYLVDSVPPDSDANHDFDALWQHLNTIDTGMLQKVAIESMRHSLVRLELLAQDEPFPATSIQRRSLIARGYGISAQMQWDPPVEIPMDPASFSDVLDDPSTLHQGLLNSLWHLWHDVYREQATEDQQQHRNAVHYHQQQVYSHELRIVFREVTGRRAPAWFADGRVKHVNFVPTSHTGALVVFSIFKENAWVGFNANLVPADHGAGRPYSAELYPVLKALADETRLKMVALLTEGEFNVGDIADLLKLTQSTASRHLSLLAKTDILNTRRDGTMRYYTLNPSTLQEISERIGQLARALPNQGDKQA